jgi:hypothetical protein
MQPHHRLHNQLHAPFWVREREGGEREGGEREEWGGIAMRSAVRVSVACSL